MRLHKGKIQLLEFYRTAIIRNDYRKNCPPEVAKKMIKYFDIFKDIVDSVFENNENESIEIKIRNIRKRLMLALPLTISEYYCNGIENCLKSVSFDSQE